MSPTMFARLKEKGSERTMFCTRCFNTGLPNLVTKGSFGIELVLWLFLLIPGIIYSIWRVTTRHWACPHCGSADLVPPDSPRAQQLSAAERLGTR